MEGDVCVTASYIRRFLDCGHMEHIRHSHHCLFGRTKCDGFTSGIWFHSIPSWSSHQELNWPQSTQTTFNTALQENGLFYFKFFYWLGCLMPANLICIKAKENLCDDFYSIRFCCILNTANSTIHVSIKSTRYNTEKGLYLIEEHL